MQRILVLGAERKAGEVLQKRLELAGFSTAFARDADEAAARLGRDPEIEAAVVAGAGFGDDVAALHARLRGSDFLRDVPVVPGEGDVMAALSAALSAARAHPLVSRQRRGARLMGEGRFVFRTVQEAHDVSLTVAAAYPDPDMAAYGLGELTLNAVEHGNLGITFAEKAELLSTGRWQEEVERRLLLPEFSGRFATLTYRATGWEIVATIEDRGEGFEWKSFLDIAPERAHAPNGRGIALARLRAFPLLEYNSAGNKATCAVNVRGQEKPEAWRASGVG